MTEPLVQDAAAAVEADAAIIYKGYLGSIEELVEHARAADTLGLGFRVESYLVTSTEEPNSGHNEFEFTLLAEMPEKVENGE